MLTLEEYVIKSIRNIWDKKRTYLNERPRDCSPPSKMRLKESLNTECPKLSDKTTRPPVLSIATFISASPTC